MVGNTGDDATGKFTAYWEDCSVDPVITLALHRRQRERPSDVQWEALPTLLADEPQQDCIIQVNLLQCSL